MSRTRTNIEIKDDYLDAMMARYGLRTKTEAVDLALRHLAGPPLSDEEALAMEGARAMDEVAWRHRASLLTTDVDLVRVAGAVGIGIDAP